MKAKRMAILGTHKSLEWLADRDIEITLSLKVISIMKFYNKVKWDVDAFSGGKSNEIEDLVELGNKIQEYLNEEIEVETLIPWGDFVAEKLKISANNLKDLMIYMESL